MHTHMCVCVLKRRSSVLEPAGGRHLVRPTCRGKAPAHKSACELHTSWFRSCVPCTSASMTHRTSPAPPQCLQPSTQSSSSSSSNAKPVSAGAFLTLSSLSPVQQRCCLASVAASAPLKAGPVGSCIWFCCPGRDPKVAAQTHSSRPQSFGQAAGTRPP